MQAAKQTPDANWAKEQNSSGAEEMQCVLDIWTKELREKIKSESDM